MIATEGEVPWGSWGPRAFREWSMVGSQAPDILREACGGRKAGRRPSVWVVARSTCYGDGPRALGSRFSMDRLPELGPEWAQGSPGVGWTQRDMAGPCPLCYTAWAPPTKSGSR